VRHERQVDVLRRIAAAGPNLIGLFGPTSMVNPSSRYTDDSHFAEEQRVLFRGRPLYAGLSCEIPDAGSYLTAVVDGVPVAVVRQHDGTVRAMVNACRHRGAPILDGRGEGLRRLQCPYHAWTYELDGRLHSRPRSDGAFNDVELECNLHPIAVGEKYGLLFVQLGDGSVDVDTALEGAVDDLSAFGLEHYTHIETRTATWKMNWKLVLDTFTESYHIRTLHRESIATTFLSDPSVFEGFGLNFLSIGLRKTVFDELSKPEQDWSILPYGTLQYFLVPTGLVVHQLDHVETWRITPVDVRTTEVTTGVFAPEPPADERTQSYWIKNLDLLLRVTGAEDFPLMEKIQAALDSGALPAVVYGRNEPALVHFHRGVEAALMLSTTT
jgi:phenylpropionate dioxygenase-like ring-hydroxylating dioxygenase large terminal subunit